MDKEERNTSPAHLSMSVKMAYTIDHLVWAAYQILSDRELIRYRQYPLDKKFVKAYLREQMVIFGSDFESLAGERFFNDVEQDVYDKAQKWVTSRNWK